jgi:acyl-CoA reductase-like NAD-dependent aldehyde dehydrogenase
MRISDIDIPAGNLIAGRHAAYTGGLDVFSPIDEHVHGQVPDSGPSDIDDAVGAARAAFPKWAALGIEGRRAHLLAFARAIQAHKDQLALIECVDNGGLERVMRGRIVARSAQNISFFADWASSMAGRVAEGGTNHDHVRYEPAGVAALITPWNAPMMLTTWKLGPALAAGNCVVVKPPELAPASCAYLGMLAQEAGLPPGVLNIVHGRGDVAGQALVSHAGVDRISFTGSPQTARIIAHAAADTLTPLSFELGGKSPLIVFKGVDLQAAAGVIAHQYFNAGQVCLAGTRILADAAIADALFHTVKQQVEQLKVGDPRDGATDIGPLISPAQISRVMGFVGRAVADGAEVAWGGKRADTGALFYEPTMLLGVAQSSEIIQNEVFGPVLTWQTFHDEEEAIALANGTKYGLAATLFSGDEAQAMRVGAAIRAGTVWVNSFFVRNLAAPFGGFGESGIGTEGGDWSFDFFSNVKNLSVNTASFAGGQS